MTLSLSQMSTSNKKQPNSYGRRTWDRELYAALAKENKEQREGSKLQQLQQLSEHEKEQLKRKYTDRNTLLSDSLKDLNRKVMAKNVSSFKRGKQFGFYCELCDMTFKDTLQYVDHLNHKMHATKFEIIFGEPMVLDTRDNDDVSVNEFEEVLNGVIDEFVAKHNGKVSKQANGSGGGSKSKRGRRRSSRTRERGDKHFDTKSKVAKVMGFSSFGHS